MPCTMFLQNQAQQHPVWSTEGASHRNFRIPSPGSVGNGEGHHPNSTSPFTAHVAPTVSVDPSPHAVVHNSHEGRSPSCLSLTPASSSNQELRPSNKNCPPHGAKGQQGSRPSMEDAYAAVPNLVVLADCLAVTELLMEVDTTGNSALPNRSDMDCLLNAADDRIHFYGVFDGHGGTSAADHCAKTLHRHLRACLLGEVDAQEEACAISDSVTDFSCLDESLAAQPVLRNVDGNSLSASQASLPDVSAYTPQPKASAKAVLNVPVALKHAFLRADLDLAAARTGESVGTTAVVALVSEQRIWISHCGDSRAVISVNGLASSLTEDHKPERRDEAERVEKAGGRILFRSGSYRVNGMLAMSRALGDHYLRPFVIPEPEISVHRRTDADELIVIASDGLWDVFCNQDAVDLARRSLDRAAFKGASRTAACRVAASVLAKAAVDKGSHDNVTVIVVDLRKDLPGALNMKRLKSEPFPMDHLPLPAEHVPLVTQHSMSFP